MHWEDRFRQMSSGQEGLVARFQLPAMGCTIDDWWNARRNGRWSVMSSRLILLPGLAAVRRPPGAGRRPRHQSGGGPAWPRPRLAWLGLGDFDLRTIQVARPRGLTGHNRRPWPSSTDSATSEPTTSSSSEAS